VALLKGGWFYTTAAVGLDLRTLRVVWHGEFAGPLGMFLAVPVVAALRIIWRDSRQQTQGPPAAVRRAS